MDAAHIEMKTRRYYEQLFALKCEKVDVIDKFLETQNWLKKMEKT